METLRRTFQSLSVRNFRLFVLGQLLSVTCTWMMVIAQDWLVLELSGDSGTALGVVTALQFTPVLLLTLYGGRLADRHSKRSLLMLANSASGVLALALGLWILLGEVRLWHIWLFALALGTVNAVEAPTRISFVGEMVGGELLPNASAMSAAYFNVARVVGPAIAGFLIARLDVAAVVLINAVSYLGTVASVALMRPAELHVPAERPARPRVADGLRYVGRRPDLVLPLVLLGVVGLAGFNFQLTLPLMAKTEFHTDSTAFGLLSSSLAAGSLLAAFATTARRGRPSALVVTGSALAFGATEALAGLAPTLTTACLLLTLTGFTMMYFAQASNHRVQLGTDPAYRGRVMALYTVIFQGGTPLGALLTGWLAEHWGPRWALSTGGLITLTTATLTLTLSRRPAPPTPEAR
ncbi:MFS transporter [Streptomyces lavendulae]|uniref:Enterobactin exporter EntS n=1 Tax=Streptomyces lavendulae subsp. lavendulae TaxID=58340 RepID=A0A2K8PFS5_STRLA|nr:MFS transporter [Streptomyces lavendulae]ATZ24465.1 enterobactin exporter EntS [Streptomyces lavendulae subsp. lavendulae]QUQ54295.1 Enterobactin exporter EntS [Streptomyces lavendulae subsp. lavendulae]